MYTNKEIQHCRDRIEGLHMWIQTHAYTHPSHDLNVRDMHLAEVKLAKMTQPRPMNAPEEFQVPKSNK